MSKATFISIFVWICISRSTVAFLPSGRRRRRRRLLLLLADKQQQQQQRQQASSGVVLRAAAAGFGGSNTAPSSKSTSRKKKGKKGSKRKRGFVAAAAEVDSSSSKPETQTKHPKQNKVILENDDEKESSQRELDKWGLPPPTIEDIFPPMPDGTELLPATKEDYSLQEIQNALKKHIRLKLDRFHDDGVEKNPIDGRLPMKIRLLHRSPPVLAFDHFFTEEECQETEQVAIPSSRNKIGSSQRTVDVDRKDKQKGAVQVDSATFSPLATSKRTSTSWFCHYAQVPVLLSKAYHILGIPLEQMEEPQIVRYETGQEFSWHYDEVPAAQLCNGGQRLATLLVYLNTCSAGGGTVFRDLEDATGHALTKKPVQGTALLFFPAYADGRPDDRTLHKGEVAQDEKRIVQMWIHERSYQAVLPPGNSQEVAQEAVDQVSRRLGYI